MRTSAAALLTVAFAASVNAHTRIYSAWVNGVDQGDGRTTYIRSPPNNDPVKDVTSPDLVCNVAGATPAAEFVSAAAGDTVTLEWYHDNRGDDIIASSHKGPIITYIAPYFEDDGASAIWTKVQEAGYDATAKTWAVDDLITNKGKVDFTIPSTLAPGQYVVRQEIIALHEADTCYATAQTRGAQFYPSCVQFEITGSGTAVPGEAFDFNAEYSCADAGIEFNLYGTFTEYTIPGPSVDSALASTGSTSTGSTGTTGTTGSSSSPAASSAAPAVVAATPVASSAPAATTAAAAVVATPSAVSSGTTSGCKHRKARAVARDALRA